MEQERLTEQQIEGLETNERVQEMKRAYDEALEICRNLDNPKGKVFLELLNSASTQPIFPDDFQGASLVQDFKEKEDLYGVEFYPLTFLMDTDHYRKLVQEKLKSNPAFSGVFLSSESLPFPFNKTGFAFLDTEVIEMDAHEDLHRVFKLFGVSNLKPEDEELPDDKYLKKWIENKMLGEIFAHRDGRILPWVSDDNKKATVCTVLIDCYLQEERRDEFLDIDVSEDYDLDARLGKACRTMEFLESQFSQSIISHILLNCRNLDDLSSWLDIKEEDEKNV